MPSNTSTNADTLPKVLQIKEITADATINIVLDTLEQNKQAIVFCNSKRSAEKCAEDSSRKINTATSLYDSKNKTIILSESEKKQLSEISEDILHALSKPTKQCERLAECVKKGVAYHHAGLVHEQKSIIEDAFRKSLIKIICATPTLALGVSLPAFRVIIKDLRRYYHGRIEAGNENNEKGMRYIPVLEYHQMAGRAGRPEHSKIGEAITIASTEAEKQKINEIFINGEPEDIYSKLGVEPVLRSCLLSLIATNFVTTKEQILLFFNKTFWAHQFGDMYHLTKIIDKVLGMLEEFGFIELIGQDKLHSQQEPSYNSKTGYVDGILNKNTTNEGFTSAAELFSAGETNKIFFDGMSEKNNKINGSNNKTKENANNLKERVNEIKKINSEIRYNATHLGKRVSELYIDPLTAHEIILAMERAQDKRVLTIPLSFLHMISCALELRPKLNVKSKEIDDIMQKLVESEGSLIVLEPSQYEPEYDNYINSFKTALFFQDWIDEMDEEYLLEKYDIRPGEIKVKLDIADWLVYSSSELCKLLTYQNMLAEINKLRIRLKYGTKEELLALLKLENIGRMRARKLYSHGIKDIGDVKKANIVTLAQLIGKSVAINIKEQVGEKVKKEDIEVKENKRKGQISLKDF
ncbi:hypothetical protein HY636_04220 [Candidatus Woesearchaeota archaeon]|nr:hypothetical protein [Candidatus Woesearchaeota archaeon]